MIFNHEWSLWHLNIFHVLRGSFTFFDMEANYLLFAHIAMHYVFQYILIFDLHACEKLHRKGTFN